MKIRLAYRILTVLFIGFCSCFLSTTGEVQAGSIEGKVLDSSTSAPIVNLTVGAYHEDDANKLIKYAETNTLGLFTLNNLPEGTYKIVFFTYNTNYIREWYKSGDSDAYDFAAADSIPVASDPVPLENTFLQEGAKITGTVTEEDGVTAIEGITAIAYDSNGNWATSAAPTGIDGFYALGGLRPGEYKIKFRAAGTVYSTEWYQDNHYTFNPADVVTLSSLSDNLTINAELGPGGSISGQVTDIEGTPIVDALVKVYDSNSDDTDSPIEFATTGTDGFYTVTGLPALGVSFKVQFFEREGDGSGAGLTEWYDNVSYFTSATTVNAGKTGVDAVLEPSNTVNLIPAYFLLWN